MRFYILFDYTLLQVSFENNLFRHDSFYLTYLTFFLENPLNLKFSCLRHEQICCLHSLLLNYCQGYKIQSFVVLNALHAIFLAFIRLSESISYFQLKSTQTLLAPNSIKHEMLGTNGGKDSVCIRTFFAEQMTCVCTVEDVETTRTYKKIP